jgi:hypothetical protein
MADPADESSAYNRWLRTFLARLAARNGIGPLELRAIGLRWLGWTHECPLAAEDIDEAVQAITARNGAAASEHLAKYFAEGQKTAARCSRETCEELLAQAYGTLIVAGNQAHAGDVEALAKLLFGDGERLGIIFAPAGHHLGPGRVLPRAALRGSGDEPHTRRADAGALLRSPVH